MPLERLDAYVEEVRAAAARHDDITVLLGLEAEYVPGSEAELERLLDRWPFEIVVLGVHVVDGFAFDDPSLRADPRWDDPDALLAAYYRTVRRAAEYGPLRRPRPPRLHRPVGAPAGAGCAARRSTRRSTPSPRPAARSS